MTPDETANTAREQVLNELLLRKQQRKKRLEQKHL